MVSSRILFLWLFMAAVLLAGLAGCNPARIDTQSDYRGPVLPRPERVLVRDFTLASDDVQLDQGLRARLSRLGDGSEAGQQRAEVARQLTDVLADTMVQKLRSYGVAAERSFGAETGGAGPTVVVEGAVVSVDEGNRTRRTLIGLGAGMSRLRSDARLFYEAGLGQPRLLETFSSVADSGHAPGAAETMGAGAAAGSSAAAGAAASLGLHGVTERRAAEPQDLARKTADGVAERVGRYFVTQGWLPPGAVR